MKVSAMKTGLLTIGYSEIDIRVEGIGKYFVNSKTGKGVLNIPEEKGRNVVTGKEEWKEIKVDILEVYAAL